MIPAAPDALLAQLDSLPGGAFRDFHRWVLQNSSEPIQGRWLKANGWRKLEWLAGYLFAGLVRDEDHACIFAALDRLHVYAVYVSAADVLEDVPKHHPQAARVQKVIHGFNAAMTVALRGEHDHGLTLLRSLADECAALPAFSWRLFPREHLELARNWSSDSLATLEHESILMTLWMQMLAGEQLVRLADGFPLASIVEEGVRARYQAVDALLGTPPGDLNELLEMATWSVLVSPSLACYLLALQRARPELRLDAAAWRAPLYDAALLVRLLNDYGPLVLMDEEQQRLLDRDLTALSQGTFGEAILTGLPTWKGLFTRLRRDLQYGEFSLALHGLETHSVTEARAPFMKRLTHFNRIYRDVSGRMDQALEAITASTGQPEPVTLVRRFVNFHTTLYSRPADTSAGDYRME